MKKNILYTFTWIAIWIIWVASASISWPPTPSWEPDSWLFMTYINKILVNTNISTTDWKVKKSLDADTLWSGVVVVTSWNVWVWTSSPQAKLDVNWKLKTNQVQISSTTQSGYILVSDSSWNWTWLPNNYRLKVKSLSEWNPTWWYTNCVLMEDSTVKCWWYNWHGQLWIWTHTTDRTLPSTLPLKWVSRLFNIWWSHYALMEDWSVYGWWYNGYWHLWLWHTSNVFLPTKIPNLTATDLFLWGPYTNDYPFVCAKIWTWTTATAKCWWYNWYWQLWDWTSTSKNNPTDVVWLTNVKYIRWTWWNSWGHTCALLNDWTVKCWWYNAYWQLWLWNTATTTVPTTVPWVNNVRDLFVWDWRTCVILNDNVTLRCWGYNNYAQLCDWTTVNKTSPVTISTWWSSIKEVVMSNQDYFSTWVLFNNWTVRSCGYNWYWQLWLWDTTQRSGLIEISWLTNVKKVKNSWTWSYWTTCALLNDWTVKCWWRNATGQLWQWDTSHRYTPTTVLWIENAIDINSFWHSNVYHFSVLLSDWSMMVWWYANNWYLWQWDNLSYYIPVKVKNLNTD